MKKLIAIISAAILVLQALPALADSMGSVTITNMNTATVTNSASVSSSSGHNTANGAAGANTVASGDISNSGKDNKVDASANTALGGKGGTITTGVATAALSIENDINWNDASVTLTHAWSGTSTADILNDNLATVTNTDLTSVADSGSNTVLGSTGTNSVTGGGVSGSGDGNGVIVGGNGASGGDGGSIAAGDANAVASILTILNKNISRIELPMAQ